MMPYGRRQFLSRAANALVVVSAAWITPGVATGSLRDENRDPLKPDLIFRQLNPRNAEPPLPALVESWITPERLFYVRSHGPNPVIDPEMFRLRINGMVERPAELSLKDLETRFSRVSCVCTMTCAGNRRYEHSKVKPVGGVQWEEGPIGNAKWSGFRLSDVLKSIGVKDGAQHVWFDGLDEVEHDGGVIPFGGSVPLSKVAEQSDAMPGVLLATHMNDEPLPVDHGFPLRTVVPGYIGARSVKWLGNITVSDRPSPNHFVADVYKLLETGAKTEQDEAAPIYRFIVNAALCSAVQQPGVERTLRLRGYALPTGLRGSVVSRVEISADEGQSWQTTRLEQPNQEYCWALWEADVQLGADSESLLIRATDSAGHQQPEAVPWNSKGYMYNAWHRVPLE